MSALSFSSQPALHFTGGGGGGGCGGCGGYGGCGGCGDGGDAFTAVALQANTRHSIPASSRIAQNAYALPNAWMLSLTSNGEMYVCI